MRLGLTPEAAQPLRDAWTDLAERALEPSVFNHPAFALPAALHLPEGRHARILTAWHPDEPSRLIGLCCIAIPMLGLPVSAWLHPQATAAFPLLDAETADLALVNLMAQTAGVVRPAGLLMHGVPAEGATMALLHGLPGWSVVPVASRSRAVMRRVPPAPSGKAGKEFRRQARRLGEQGCVSFTAASDPAGVAGRLETFLHMEAGGWKGRRGTALGQTTDRARFVRAMVAGLAEQEGCRIDTMQVDGRPVAMGLVLRSGPTAFFWKTAFDESFARFSPGAHLAEAIGRQQAEEPGLEMTDSCAIPGHAMIDRLWPERMVVIDALVAPSARLRWPLRAALQAERLRRAVRTRVAGLVALSRRPASGS